jgi:hypothetical protein
VILLILWPIQAIAASAPEDVSIELDGDNHFVRLKAVDESRLLIGKKKN